MDTHSELSHSQDHRGQAGSHAPFPQFEKFQADPKSELHFYYAKRLHARGRRPESFSLGEVLCTQAYTWKTEQQEWRTDTLLLSVKPNCLRQMAHTLYATRGGAKLDFPEKAWEMLFHGFSGPPIRLVEALQKHGKVQQGDLSRHTFSCPIPLYHASGMSKDVYFFHMLVLPRLGASGLIEVPLALKVAQRNNSITDNEIHYHSALSKLDKRRYPHISQLLGEFVFPSKSEEGNRLVLEAFESGSQAAEFLNSRRHLNAASQVTRTAFEIMKLASQAGFGNLGGVDEYAIMQRVRFPSDINPGNFLIRPNGSAVLVDTGAHQPAQTFTEIVLLLIETYWNISDRTKQNRGDVLLPLTPLFQEVLKSFGNEKGMHLLSELRTTLGFFRGTPIERLVEQSGIFTQQQVHSLGQTLAAIYTNGHDTHGMRISSARALLRENYFRAISEFSVIDKDSAHASSTSTDQEQQANFEATYYRQGAVILRQTDGELDRIAKELDQFFSAQQHPKDQSEESSMVAYRQRLNGAISRKIFSRNEANKLTRFSSTQVRSRSRFGDEMIGAAYFFAPFPDPAIVRLGLNVAMLSPWESRKKTSQTGQTSLLKRTHRAAFSLHDAFPDLDLTRSLSDSMLAFTSTINFHQLIAKGFSQIRQREYETVAKSVLTFWSGLLVSTRRLYLAETAGAEALRQIQRGNVGSIGSFRLHMKVETEGFFKDLREAFPIFAPFDHYNGELDARESGLVQEMVTKLLPSLMSKNPPDNERTIPKFHHQNQRLQRQMTAPNTYFPSHLRS